MLYCAVLLGCGTAEIIATGTSYTFKPDVTGVIESIEWKHNGNLVVEWGSNTKLHWYRYEERAQLNTENGSLTLRLTKNDSGVFEGRMQVLGILKNSKFEVEVLGK